MGMNGTKAPEAGSAAQAESGKVGNPDPGGSPDNDVSDVSPPVDQKGQLPVGIQRQFGQGSGKFRRDDALRRDSSVVEGQDLPGLRGFQAQGIPENLLDLNEPPSGFLFKQGFQLGQGLIPFPAPLPQAG